MILVEVFVIVMKGIMMIILKIKIAENVTIGARLAKTLNIAQFVKVLKETIFLMVFVNV
jgi:hypothetical protein